MAHLIDDLIGDKKIFPITDLTDEEKACIGHELEYIVVAKPKKQVFIKRLIDAYYVLIGKYEAVYFYEG